MRRSFTVLAPVATGLLVLGLAAAYPASAVRGSGLSGPKPPRSVAVPALPADGRVRWRHREDDPVLRVRAECRPELLRRSSTGPGRVELDVDLRARTDCGSTPRWWSVPIGLPAVMARNQALYVLVDGRGASVPAPRT